MLTEVVIIQRLHVVIVPSRYPVAVLAQSCNSSSSIMNDAFCRVFLSS